MISANKLTDKYLRSNISALDSEYYLPIPAITFWEKVKVFFNGQEGMEALSSTPFLFEVISDPVVANNPETERVTLFGAERSFGSGVTNFANPTSIHFNYLLSGYYGGGESGYRALLQRSSSHAFRIGKIRVEAKNEQQLVMPLTFMDNDPTGKSCAYKVEVGKLTDEQIAACAVEYNIDHVIYGGTSISYDQIPGNTVTFYLWTVKKTYTIYPLITRLKKAFGVITGRYLFE